MLYHCYLLYDFCSLWCSNYLFHVFYYLSYVSFLVFVLFCLFCVSALFCVLFPLLYIVVSVPFVYRPLPPGANRIAVNKYHIILARQRDTYFAHEQVLSTVSVTGGASRVIKWNPTPKITNEMTTPTKEQMCYISTLHTKRECSCLFSLLSSTCSLSTELNLNLFVLHGSEARMCVAKQ